MRVGFDNKWGFTFKNDSGVSLEQEAIVGSNLARLDGERVYLDSSSFQLDEQKHYLPEDIEEIIGVFETEGDVKSIGIIWGKNIDHILEACYYASIDVENVLAPYIIKPDKRYYVKDGEVYEIDK